jgi:hypothetical protein
MLNKSARWRNIPYTNGYYQISEHGDLRVVSKKCRLYGIGIVNQEKYEAVPVHLKRRHYRGVDIDIPTVSIKTAGASIELSVSSLMYAAFHGLYNVEPENILHLDCNELNCSIGNLILCEKDDKIHFVLKNKSNALLFQYPTLTAGGFKAYSSARRSLGISEYNLEGKRVEVYLNAAHLSKVSGINLQTVKKVVSGFKFLELNKRIFKVGFGPKYIDTHLIAERKMVITNHTASNKEKKVFRYDTKGRLNYVYNNFFEAAAFNSIDPERMKDCMRSQQLCNDFVFLAAE